jgi:plasmid stability protein
MVRQCAWCWLVADTAGRYRLQPGEKLREATHGICPTCEARERAIIDGFLPAERRRAVVALAS